MKGGKLTRLSHTPLARGMLAALPGGGCTCHTFQRPDLGRIQPEVHRKQST
jgi:hypothetical protein